MLEFPPMIVFSEWLELKPTFVDPELEAPGISAWRLSFKTFTRFIFCSSTSFLNVYPTKLMSFLCL